MVILKMLKDFLPKTLFGRSFMIMVTPILLLQLIVTFIFFDRHWDTMTRRLSYAVAGEVAFVVETLPQVSPDNQKDFLETVSHSFDLSFDFSPALKVPSESWDTPLSHTLAASLKERLDDPFIIQTDTPDESVDIYLTLEDGILIVTAPQRRLYSSTAFIFILWMIGSSLVLFSIALIFMRNQIKPILRLATAAENFGKGREVKDFKPQGALEIRQAGQAFLTMRRRLKRQMSRRTEMLAGISHDLRTPLTRMKLQMAMLDPSAIAELEQDVGEMEQMINAYLAFAKGEEGETPESVKIAPFLKKIAKENGIVLKVPQNIKNQTLLIRKQAFRRCLNNLMTNADRYATNFSMSLQEYENRFLRIIIDDDGPGIPQKDRKNVFKPFVRLDPSRNSDTGGSGLGLSIARDIANSHGGRILLEDSPEGGLRAIVQIPI